MPTSVLSLFISDIAGDVDFYMIFFADVSDFIAIVNTSTSLNPIMPKIIRGCYIFL